MSRIYLATSWRNHEQPRIVRLLREVGHEVYDFRNPPGGTGFAWRQLGSKPPWSPHEFRSLLRHPLAQSGFQSDFSAMRWADTFVLVLPCGRSAHLELGWAAGVGKRTVIYMPDLDEPELMYLCCDRIVADEAELTDALTLNETPPCASSHPALEASR